MTKTQDNYDAMVFILINHYLVRLLECRTVVFQRHITLPNRTDNRIASQLRAPRQVSLRGSGREASLRRRVFITLNTQSSACTIKLRNWPVSYHSTDAFKKRLRL